MNSTCNQNSKQSGRVSFLPVSEAAAGEVGPAAQTLAALYVLADGKTGALFHRAELIATTARLPLPTVRRHLVKLVAGGWIEHQGRQGRRTPTYCLTPKAFRLKAPYGPLEVEHADRLATWSERVVLAMATRRAWSNKSRKVRARDGLRPARLAQQTGLCEASVRSAAATLRADESVSEVVRDLLTSPSDLAARAQKVINFDAENQGVSSAKSDHRMEPDSKNELSSKSACGGPGESSRSIARKNHRHLRGVSADDLGSLGAIDLLRARAQAQGIAGAESRLGFVALALCARERGRDPGAYFAVSLANGAPDAPPEYQSRAGRMIAQADGRAAEAERRRWAAETAAHAAPGTEAADNARAVVEAGATRIGDLVGDVLARFGQAG